MTSRPAWSTTEITWPADSPAVAVLELRLRAQLSRAVQHQANARDSLAWLIAHAAALTSIIDRLEGTRDLLGADATPRGEGVAAELAQRVVGVRQAILTLANQCWAGRPLFGGTTAAAVAFDSDTSSYRGNAGAALRAISAEESVQVTWPGDHVFGADGASLFDVLGDIAAALAAEAAPDSPAAPAPHRAGLDCRAGLAQLDAARVTLVAQLAAAGVEYGRAQNAAHAAQGTARALARQLAQHQSAAVPPVIQSTTESFAYRVALQTATNLRQISLLDFLR